ncbi:MAG: inositol monophosphatase family protein [Myxococcota bacterium]
MSEIYELAREIALEAGALQRERLQGERTIETKSTAIDLVTDVDRACESLILSRIARERPDDGILSEEREEAPGSSGWVWIVDPLDGTTNYAHAFPHFAVSIGIEQRGVREVGIVYDPMKGELFSAERGRGAWLNGSPLCVSRTSELHRALLGTGFGYEVHLGKLDNLDYFRRFLERAQAVRRAGSASLDLAYVACGRYDGFWELSLHPWDVAAGYLLVEEAGGRTSDTRGGPAPRSGSDAVASNGALHAALLEVLSD